MKLDELKHIINEAVNEVDFEDNITTALNNIETWASNAKRQMYNKSNPQIFYKLIKAIATTASTILEDPEMAEGYGSGLRDPKAAHKGARWTVSYPSDGDPSKKDPVYEGSKFNRHE